MKAYLIELKSYALIIECGNQQEAIAACNDLGAEYIGLYLESLDYNGDPYLLIN